jgi:hypothetical protein
MNRGIAIGVSTLVLSVAGYAYWKHSRFDRLATRAATTIGTSDEWSILRDHPDDPRVIEAAANDLRGSDDQGCEKVTTIGNRAGPVLDKHPPKDDETLAIVADLIATCADPRAAKWTTRPPEDLVHVLRKDLANAIEWPKDVLPDALVRLSPKVNQDLVDVIVASVKADESNADALIAAGFPESGEKLVAPNANVIRRHAGTDVRVTSALRSWLVSQKELDANEAKALTRALKWAPDVSIDDAMAVPIAKSIEVPEVEALCHALVVLPVEAEIMRKHGAGPKIDACTADARQMAPALQMLLDAATAARAFEDEKGGEAKAKRDAWEDAQAEAVAKLGPIAARAAREGLKNNARTTRRVSARTFVKLDRPGYLNVMSARLHAKTANADDAQLLVELTMKTGGFAAEPILATYYAEDIEASKLTTKLLKATKPDQWVPALFADLSVKTANHPAVIGGYMNALVETPGAAAQASQQLAAALAKAGRPESIFWLTKVLALRAMKARGKSEDVPLVERFTKDKTKYPVIKLRNEKFTGEILEESRKQETIGDLATATLNQLKLRTGASAKPSAQAAPPAPSAPEDLGH